MPGLKFGAFLAPHHPLGEHPTLMLRRDLALASQLDELGFDEFWVGEHHSSGWETIASPEMFLAVAGERTARIKLGTGVVSLPYHHPFNVAQRIVHQPLRYENRRQVRHRRPLDRLELTRGPAGPAHVVGFRGGVGASTRQNS